MVSALDIELTIVFFDCLVFCFVFTYVFNAAYYLSADGSDSFG